MALFSIEFHRTEHYYHTEYIEAESKEQATEIANALLGTMAFDERLVERSRYDWGENELQYVNEVPDEFDYHSTMTAYDINEYLEVK